MYTLLESGKTRIKGPVVAIQFRDTGRFYACKLGVQTERGVVHGQIEKGEAQSLLFLGLGDIITLEGLAIQEDFILVSMISRTMGGHQIGQAKQYWVEKGTNNFFLEHRTGTSPLLRAEIVADPEWGWTCLLPDKGFYTSQDKTILKRQIEDMTPVLNFHDFIQQSSSPIRFY